MIGRDPWFKLSRSNGLKFCYCLMAGILLASFHTPAGAAFTKSEFFDSDPGWDSFNSTTAPQNFGFSATEHAGGLDSGEIGGTIVRSPLAYYADNVGSLDPSVEMLSVSGTGNLQSASGNVLVGWFDKNSSNQLHWEPSQFLGFRSDDDDLYLYSCCSSEPLAFDLFGPFTFTITYDPTANEGRGAISGSVNGGPAATRNLGAGDKDALNNFNRFGLLSLYIPGNGTAGNFFFDDLTYTADTPIPEPTDFQWNRNGPGSWNISDNWSLSTVPDSVDNGAILGGAITAPSTVFLEDDVTVKSIQFDNANTYNVAGSGGVTLAADTATMPSIQVVQGNHQFQTTVDLNMDAMLEIAAGSTLMFNNALNLNGNTLSKTGDGTAEINNILNTGGGSFTVMNGTLAGGGELGGDVENSGGLLAPGNSSSLLLVGSGYANRANAAYVEGVTVPEPGGVTLCGIGFMGLVLFFAVSRFQDTDAARIAKTLMFAGLVCGLLTVPTRADQKFENFASDPSWDEFGNMSGAQLFGYSAVTNNAGGSVGEIGGRIVRSSLAYYADDVTHNAVELDPSTDALAASGAAIIQPGSGNVLVGWFDKDAAGFGGLDWQPSDFLGFRTDESNLYLLSPMGGELVGSVTQGIPFTFDLSFDPTGNEGNGQLALSIVGGGSATQSLGEGQKDFLPSFDRFGLLNLHIPGNETSTEVYFDDLTYTTNVPQVSVSFVNWGVDASDGWHGVSNWSPGLVPDSNDLVVNFTSAITAPRTVFTDSDVTAKSINFDSANSYSVVGLGTVNLEAVTGTASIQVSQGSHEFQAVVSLQSNATADIADGTTLTFNNALNLNGNTLTQTGGGTLAINNMLHSSEGSLDLTSGRISGHGQVGGDLNNDGGTVTPGTSTALVAVGVSTVVPEPTTAFLATLALLLAIHHRLPQRA